MRAIFDTIYRISAPYNLSAFTSRKLFVFGTSEAGTVDGMFTEADSETESLDDNITFIASSHWSRQGLIRSGFCDESV
jgi:hypothetical protein